VSWGELLDKITILEIKCDRIAEPAARANVGRELRLLRRAAGALAASQQVRTLVERLRGVNEDLWDIEDDIRARDAKADFGPRFIALARLVYQRNDQRAGLKRQINQALGSLLIEEKSYAAPAPVATGTASLPAETLPGEPAGQAQASIRQDRCA